MRTRPKGADDAICNEHTVGGGIRGACARGHSGGGQCRVGAIGDDGVGLGRRCERREPGRDRESERERHDIRIPVRPDNELRLPDGDDGRRLGHDVNLGARDVERARLRDDLPLPGRRDQRGRLDERLGRDVHDVEAAADRLDVLSVARHEQLGDAAGERQPEREGDDLHVRVRTDRRVRPADLGHLGRHRNELDRRALDGERARVGDDLPLPPRRDEHRRHGRLSGCDVRERPAITPARAARCRASPRPRR